LVCYSDASLGRTDIEGKSTSGCVIKLYGDTVAWKAEKQRNVATSSMESEYVAMSKGTKMLMRIKTIKERLINDNRKPLLKGDNKSAICAAKAEMSKSLMHLTKLDFHFVRNVYKEGEIKLKWVSTKDQLADMLTKGLGRDTFEKF